MRCTTENAHRTVFVIEDDNLQCEFVRMIFEEAGEQVAPVDIDRASIEAAIQQAGPDDIFLIDILLNSDLDGFSVTRMLAQSDFQGAVVFVSGRGAGYLDMACRMATGLGLEVKAAMKKPLKARKLANCITAH